MAMLNSEKQAAFIARMKGQGYKLRSFWIDQDGNIITKPASKKNSGIVMKEIAPKKQPQTVEKSAVRLQWEAELLAEERSERLKAARKAGRDSQRKKYIERGTVEGIIFAAKSVVKRNPVIAQVILYSAQVDRQRAVNARLDDFLLRELDAASAWKKPPEEFLRD
ncbi:MAG: hypothetical protein Ta2C_10780 [Candidatus Endomicrobiellum trichonymphae]|uniref:hypothetical protein n=1 Tax=Endomicrobium trichonymphae TaxID=1408204 RepID=UPI0027D42844|nr:MAG: hypothetical protein Ta2C_10780 [Candidatus Endomicrobium trichonymphae]